MVNIVIKNSRVVGIISIAILEAILIFWLNQEQGESFSYTDVSHTTLQHYGDGTHEPPSETILLKD